MATKNTANGYKIGDVTEQLGISADTLRYYEKIGMLPPIHRAASGMRTYLEGDLSRLRFILRAKSMNFSLKEIGHLLEMREDPQNAREDVSELTRRKLKEIEDHIQGLETLRKELAQLVNLCQGTEAGCPIIEDLNSRASGKKSERS